MLLLLHWHNPDFPERIAVLRLPIVTALILTLTGCQISPTSQEIAGFDYGPYPTNYQEITKTYYETLLFDAGSAHWGNFTQPRQTWWNDINGRNYYGWGFCVPINGKNRLGAYTGYQLKAVMIRRGIVIDSEDAEAASRYLGNNRNLCQS